MKNQPKRQYEPKVSVIIPTLNGAEQLRELLASLTIQTLQPEEVLVIDSSSSDGTRDIANHYGAKVELTDPRSFDHGGTRSLAGRKARGDILVFLTQDVLPAHRAVLENLVAPFGKSDDIAVTYGRQLPAFDANDTASHLRLFNYPEKSSIRSFADRTTLGLETVFASNSCAAYRKSDLEEIGYFRTDLIFGEDTCAVGRLLEKGLKIAYIAEAAVYHSHNYSLVEDFRRYFDIGVLHTVERWLVDTYGKAEGRGLKYIQSGISYLYRRRRYGLMAEFMVRTGVKYLGYKLGRNYRIIPSRLIPEMSMHRRWWERNGQKK